MKVKRFVIEFANYEMQYCSDEQKRKIEKIIRCYKQGMLSPLETVRYIANADYDKKTETENK